MEQCGIAFLSDLFDKSAEKKQQQQQQQLALKAANPQSINKHCVMVMDERATN